ncbi:PH domain-containing protein [Haloechinothrix sp. LS1_15]|nr:PH domain-containing protein [Haloechinothrix sp. LS1_15]
MVALSGVVALLAATAATWFALAGDPPGAVLFGVIAVFFGGTTLHGTVIRPRLLAEPSGVTVRTLGGQYRAPWRRVQCRVATTRRFGRNVRTLEIDIAADTVADDDELVVFGELELGADPHEVLEELEQRRA